MLDVWKSSENASDNIFDVALSLGLYMQLYQIILQTFPLKVLTEMEAIIGLIF